MRAAAPARTTAGAATSSSIGDGVTGGNFYGTPNGSTGSIFPTLQTGGPDDTTTSTTGGRGRWIPTSASDQYGATLAKWFGVADIDLGTVFPNQGNFAHDGPRLHGGAALRLLNR